MIAVFKYLAVAFSVLYAVFSAVTTTYPSAERIWAGTAERHRTTSLIAVLLASITASIASPSIWDTYGYRHVEHAVIGDIHSLSQQVVGPQSATGSTAVALLGLSALVALVIVFSTKNSELVSSTTLVMDSIFGISLSRYGLSTAHFSPGNLYRLSGTTAMHFGTVGAVETLGTALFLALLWGIPIGALGFALDALAR